MELTLTDDQQELRRGARRFLAAERSPDKVDAMKTERGYDPATWQRICEELGWPALTIPEAYEGIGLGPRELYPLMEEMGRHVACAPFFSTVCLGVNALLCAGTEAQKQAHLPAIAAGERTATVAYTEPSGRWDASAIKATATRHGDGYVLRGHKRYVLDGHSADLLVVAARAPGSTGENGVSLFVVPATTAGVTRTWLPTMDQTRKQADVVLDGVRVPADAVMGEPGAGWAPLARTLALAVTALAAEQVGGAEACLELAVEYAKVRKQFGRPIGSFQAIKHKCADMLLLVESARSAALYASLLAAEAVEALGAGGPSAGASAAFAEAASSAKAYCSEAYFHCAGESIQIHGGIGFTWEHPAHLYFKRARSSQTLLGSPAYHRERVASLMDL